MEYISSTSLKGEKEMADIVADILTETSILAQTRFRRVSFGGCGVYVYEIGKAMRRYGFNDFKIRIYGYNKLDVTEVEHAIIDNEEYADSYDYSAWDDYGVEFVHVALQYGKQLYMCDSVTSLRRGKSWNDSAELLDGSLSFITLGHLVARECNWNATYDRRQTIAMRQMILDTFKRGLQGVDGMKQVA